MNEQNFDQTHPWAQEQWYDNWLERGVPPRPGMNNPMQNVPRYPTIHGREAAATWGNFWGPRRPSPVDMFQNEIKKHGKDDK